MMKIRAARWYLAAAVIGVALASPVAARDAAFMAPSAAGGAGDEAVQVEPKGGIDLGETNVNIARRATLFFVNESTAAVQIEKVSLNSDASVMAEISSDDCSKQGTIAPQSRCSVEVSITPSSPGIWAVEMLLTHNGAGRIARAKISGKTVGTVSNNDKKETGLDMSSKEVSPVNFGDLEVGGKAVRSALMVNDSPDPITLYSIDVIEAGNGLQLLDQGCAVDMELKPGETCPVTLVWSPTDHGQVSTDLIIRHSGRQGFAVIPIRGTTKGTPTPAGGSEEKGKPDRTTAGNGKNSAPPTPDELERAASGKIPAISSDALDLKPVPSADAAAALRLIGTVGNKALLLLPDGTTQVVSTGDPVDVGNAQKVKVTEVTPKSVDLLIDGKKKELLLGSSPDLVARAAAAAAASTGKGDSKTSGSKSGGSSGSVSGSAPSSGSSGAALPAALSGSTAGSLTGRSSSGLAQ